MRRMTVILTLGLAPAWAAACSDVAGPRHAEPPLHEADAPSRPPTLGALVATPCDVGSWGPGLDHFLHRRETVLVDVTFGRPRGEGPADAPTAYELSLVAAHGGTVLHRFQAPAVRARMPLSRIPALIAGEDWVTVRTVADPARHDLGVEVDFGRPVGMAELETIRALGGRVTEHHAGLPVLSAVIPDAALSSLRGRLGAASVTPERIYCPAG